MNALRKFRTEAGLTQEDLAKKMKVSARTVRAWEKQLPGEETIISLATVLKNCRPADLLTPPEEVAQDA